MGAACTGSVKSSQQPTTPTPKGNAKVSEEHELSHIDLKPVLVVFDARSVVFTH